MYIIGVYDRLHHRLSTLYTLLEEPTDTISDFNTTIFLLISTLGTCTITLKRCLMCLIDNMFMKNTISVELL